MIIAIDIEEETVRSTDYRRVISTSDEMQLVLMSLLPDEEIGSEIHDNITQFIRVESGTGIAELDEQVVELYPGMAVFIPAGMRHNIINTGNEDLKLYTLYAPPNHPSNRIQHERPADE